MEPIRKGGLHLSTLFQLLFAVLSLLILMGQPQAMAAPGDIVTVAGGGAGDGDQALRVPLKPVAMSYDSSGNLLVADCDANRVRKIDPSGVITTIAGVGGLGFYGDGGPATDAALSCPSGVAVDGSGNVFISDEFNHRIRKIDASGIITTIAGTGTAGFSGDGGQAASATMNRPMGLAVDASGAVYFADYANQRVRKVSSSGTITTVAGNGVAGFSGDGGSGTYAKLNYPVAVAVDSYGKVYIADTNNFRVRRVDSFGTISTFAGNGTFGSTGDNGNSTLASLRIPLGVHVDASGKVYIADDASNCVRVVNSAGVITTFAGTGSEGYSGDGGAATYANLYNPSCVASNGSGAVVIGDESRIRKVNSSGIISTIAGSGTDFYGEGIAATAAAFSRTSGVAMDPSGNIYVTDYYTYRVRKITPDGIINTSAGKAYSGSSGDGGPAILATLNSSRGVAADSAGNYFFADSGGFIIRKVDATGIISTVAGTGGGGFSGDYGPATSATLNAASNVAVDPAGNLLISDTNNHRIRKVDAAGIITTIAGTGVAGFSGEGGPALSAKISSPKGIATDAAGNIYFCDRGNSRIRKIDTSGFITTIGGNGTAGYGGDGGDALAASMQNADGIGVDGAGNVYFVDTNNQRLRKIAPYGIITTVAGDGEARYAGDNGPAASASLRFPTDLFVDTAGNILIADQFNRIRKISAISATGTVIINDGAQVTASQDVTLSLSCPSQFGTCSQMQLSNNGVAWSASEAFTAGKAWTLTSGDGVKWVFAKYQDESGTWSAVQSGTIILDTAPPAITITSPQSYSNSSAPLLSFTLSDGSATVKVDGVLVNTVSGGYLDSLPEGTHTVRVEAVDALGNTGFLEKVFTVDTVSPAVSVTSPVAGTTYITPPTLLYTVSDGTVTVKLDDATVSKISGNALDGLAEGGHVVRVESRDLAGNIGYSEVQFGIDLPPAVTITSPGSGATTNSTPLLSYSTSNGTVVVRVDGVVVNKVSGNTLGPLTDGTHTILVEATDAAGTGFAEYSFTVDTVPPVVTLTSPTVSTTESQPLLTYTVSDGTVTVKVDGVVVSKVSGNRLAALALGTHTVRVESRDAVGNLGVAEVTFNVTETSPVFYSEDFESGTMTNIPWLLSGNGLWTAKSSVKHAGTYAAEAPVSITDSQSATMEISKLCTAANISFWFSVSSEANYDYLNFYIDDVLKARWAGTVPWTQVSYPVSAGNHTFKWVYSKDYSVSSGSDAAWVDDIVFPSTPSVPTVTINSPAGGVTNNSRPIVNYSVSEGAVVLKVDGAVVSKVSGDTLDTLSDGSHTVRVEATNAAGTGSAQTTFTVDTSLPGLTIDPVSTPTATNSQTITGTRESNASISVSVNTAATLDATSFPTSTTWSCLVNGLVEGANTVTVTATDGANNSFSSAVTISLDTTAPAVTISAPLAETINSRTPVISYSVSEGTAVVTLDGIVVTKASGDTLGPLADGPHTVRVSALDTAGNSAFAEVSFSVDATAPTVTITSPTTGSTSNRTPVLAFTVSEGIAVVTVDGTEFPLASGEQLGPFSDGLHTVRVAVTDAAGNPAFAEVSFMVDTSAPAVSISSPAAGISNNNVPVLNFTASEGTVVVKVDGVIVTKVSGDALDLLADGLHVVRVEATDSAGNSGFAETAFSIDTVGPVVGITSPVAGPTGSTPELAFTASDGSVVVKVDGVIVNKVSGDWLDQLVTGPHMVRVEAADAAGNVGFAEVTFSVESYTVTLNPGPNGSISGPAVVTYGETPTYTIVPNLGYHIADVTVDGIFVGAVTSYSFNLGITGNTTIGATFAIDSFSITASAGANGTIAGPAAVNYGDSASYTIAPSVGYHVADVLVDGVSIGAVTSYNFSNVTASHTISVSFTINSYSIAASAGANGSIAGPVSVNHGDSANYTITPSVGYHVADVLVDGISVGAVTSYSFTNVTTNHTISASFAINSYSIEATPGANGSITGPAAVNYGDSANYTITPAAGYHVTDVLVDGVSVGAVTSYSFNNVTASHTISATFAINSYSIEATTGVNGSISGPAAADYGASAVYTITPAEGYHVAEVLVDGISFGAVASYSFSNVTADHTISASFAINSYTITALPGANGTISGPATVNYGDSATYTITPAVGYRVSHVKVNGVDVGPVTSYTFTDVTAPQSITAIFAVQTFTFAIGHVGPGTVSGPYSVSYGQDATFSLTADPGYHLADVEVDGVSVGAVTTYTFTNVTANHSITGKFYVDTFTITTSYTGSGYISGSGTVIRGTNPTVGINPAVGHHTVDVVVDGVSVGPVASYTFNNVSADHTVSASFAINIYSITLSAGTNGSIAGPTSVNHGDSATYIITPAAGYRTASLSIDGVSVDPVMSYSFAGVTVNHTISATFAPLADLVVNSVTAPQNTTRGASISVSSSIGNQGGNAGSFTVAFYLSKDTIITSSDTLLGTATVTSLNGGGATTVSGSFTVPTGIPNGKYHVGVIADSGSVVNETAESNNTGATGNTTNVK